MNFKNFTEFLEFYLNKYKEKIYYSSDLKKKQITYGKLLKIIKNFKTIINNNKLKNQDKVMVICDNSENLVLIFLSILYHKLIFVPLNPNSTRDEFNYIFKTTKPKIIITTNKLAIKFKIKNNFFLIEEFIEFKKSIKINKKFETDKTSSKTQLISQILFTSGSTGKPKGVILTHQSMIENLYGIYKSINIRSKKLNFLSVTPLYHNNGQFIPTLLPILIGGRTLSISPDTSLINFWPIVKKYKINYSSVMATHINYFNTLKSDKKHDLKMLFCGGAKLDKFSQIKFEKNFNIKVLCNYGLTETSSIASTESTYKNSYKYGSVGKPLYNNYIKIKKKKNEKFGEILVKGKNIFKEYLNEKKKTNLVKRKDGWFCTGDLGMFDKHGYLYIKDRIDNMILVSGENIYPTEIENIVNEHKRIKLGAVTSIKDKITQNKLILVYEPVKNINNTKIYKFLEKKLSKYKIPKVILSCKDIGIREIPKAANKKILRKNLKLAVSKLLKKF